MKCYNGYIYALADTLFFIHHSKRALHIYYHQCISCVMLGITTWPLRIESLLHSHFWNHARIGFKLYL